MALESEARMEIWTVGELTRRIRLTLERAFPGVVVEGEVSNVRSPASGHLYFTLKDAEAQIQAVVWRSQRRFLKVEPADGMAIRVWGDVTVYEKGGQYQIDVRRAELRDVRGDLLRRFEALKARLRAEGLFEESRKRPLPMLPRRIGIVTSPTGAAWRDILSVFGRRFPNLHLILSPTRVQGEGAEEEIARAIERLNRHGQAEVILVARGGGSLEDLWCFNEERVARAIAASAIPVISAVGHDVDYTISDFVADVRAPTPSAAAEMVVGRKEEFEERLRILARRLVMGLRVREVWRDRLGAGEARLRQALRGYLRAVHQRLTSASDRSFWRFPRRLLDRPRERLLRSAEAMRRTYRDGLHRTEETLDYLAHRLAVSARTGLLRAAGRLERDEVQLQALNPLAVLSRGYSVTFGSDGRVVRSVRATRPGDRLRTRVSDGTIESEVKESHATEQKQGEPEGAQV